MYKVTVKRYNPVKNRIYLAREYLDALTVADGCVIHSGAKWASPTVQMLHALRYDFTEGNELDFVKMYRNMYPLRQVLQAVELWQCKKVTTLTDVAIFIANLAKLYNPDVRLLTRQISGRFPSHHAMLVFDPVYVEPGVFAAYYTNTMLEIEIRLPDGRFQLDRMPEFDFRVLQAGNFPANICRFLSIPEGAEVEVIDRSKGGV